MGVVQSEQTHLSLLTFFIEIDFDLLNHSQGFSKGHQRESLQASVENKYIYYRVSQTTTIR
jgi:hypothetical protein